MKDKPTSFNAALFDGVLTCTSADRLKTAVINGVGRGKAFGMGLLSLAALK
jgi:CRISPR system Cascade subunit CasE